MAAPSTSYEARCPAQGTLYQIVHDHFETFRAQAAGLRDGEGLPRFVEQEFRNFLRCGWLAGGFARFHCGDCGLDRLVPFPVEAAPCVRVAAADKTSAQDLYRSQLAKVRSLYEITAQRSAQTAYFLGMIGGLVLLSLIAGVVAAFQPTHVSWWSSQPALILQSLVVGGIGAIVSVMHRMSSGAVSIKHRAGPVSLVVAGASRPLVGAIIGVMAYAIAFFTGFAERLAQDTLTTKEPASDRPAEPVLV